MGRLATIALVGVLAVGCSCGGDDESPPPTSSRPPSTTTSTPTTPSPESQVEEAYLAYWEMTVRLQQAPDPEDPEIRQRAIGRAADALIDGLTTLHAQEHLVRVGPRYAHDIASVQFDSRGAVVRDCFVDDAATIDSSGERVSGGLVSGTLIATLVDVGGDWRVSELEIEDSQEGVGGCAGS